MASLIPLILKTPQGLASLTLHPAVPAAALAFIAYGPRHPVDQLLRHPAVRKLLATIRVKSLQTPLRVLLALGIARLLNRTANRRALNNWRLSANTGWSWPAEIAVVTGGCNGIGKAIVLGLVKKGVTVAILDVAELPEDLANDSKIHYWRCDITSSAAVKQTADQIREKLGHPSILINNAGVGSAHSILDTTEQDLRRLFSINLLSHWSTTQQFLPNMILKNKGHILTMASMSSFTVIPGIVDYASSKAGAMAFHEGLATEIRHLYKSPGIMTTAVHPNWVLTNLTARDSERIRAAHGALMAPEDISRPVLEQIFSCRGGQLIIPGSMAWASGLRGLPNWMYEGVRDLISKDV